MADRANPTASELSSEVYAQIPTPGNRRTFLLKFPQLAIPRVLTGLVRIALVVGMMSTGLSISGTVALAQAAVLDAGSFTVTENGARLGREQFSVRRAPAPDGTAFELRSESVFGERRIVVQQSVDSMGSPVHYTLEIRDGTAVDVRAGGQRVRGRFATLARRSGGEAAREYMLADDVIVLEPGFYHQLENVLRGRLASNGSRFQLTVLSVLENSQQQLTLILEAREDALLIGGTRATATRWRLEGGTSPVRTLWGDAQGRLLKVVIPARSIEAIRDELPK